MPTLSIWLLVAALSGVPATAVLCDLLLCAEEAASQTQGCHEHPQPSGDAVSASSRGCTHLSDGVPSVPAGSRVTLAAAPAAPAAATPRPRHIDAAGAVRTPSRAAPLLSTIPLALRI